MTLTDQPAAVTISGPVPTTGPREDARYYTVSIDGEGYRLHNEWALGADFHVGSTEHWERTDVGQLDLPPDALIALREIWASLFVVTPA